MTISCKHGFQIGPIIIHSHFRTINSHAYIHIIYTYISKINTYITKINDLNKIKKISKRALLLAKLSSFLQLVQCTLY